MHTGQTERLPANLQILAVSIIFTLVFYAVFRGLWKINVPFLLVLAILALQAATVLLGNRGILNSIGAASVAVFLAMAGYFAIVFLLFPMSSITRLAGIAGGAASAIFVLASTVTSFRAGALDLEILDDLQTDTVQGEDLPGLITDEEHETYALGLMEDDDVQIGKEILLDDPIDLSEGMETFQRHGPDMGGFFAAGRPGREYVPGGDIHVPGNGADPSPEAGGSAGFQLRCRYRVIEAATGEPLGIFYSDEGHSSLDPETLGTLLKGKSEPGELRIVNLDWSNFDEVEVQVERVRHREGSAGAQAVRAGDPVNHGTRASDEINSSDDTAHPEPVPADLVPEPDGEPSTDERFRRYVIYERRTMRPLGEYVPEGERPRLDRLTLYRLFPEYDFRTFQIDSIRWLEGEVGIFIKGEKKKDEEEKQ